MVHVPFIGTITTKFAEQILTFGVLGVELFFVLSGFLIGNILIKTFMNTADFSFGEVRHFWVRRWFRTLPNYWLILTVNIVLYHYLHLADFEVNHLRGYFFLQNLWYPNFLQAFPEGWSLSVEEWFYLTLPVVIFLSAVIFKPADKSKFLLRVFIGYLSVFLLTRFFNAFSPINGADPDEGLRKVVLFRLDAVMYGVLFAYFNFAKKQILDRIKNYLVVISIIAMVAIFYLLNKYDLIFGHQQGPALVFARNAFQYLIIPLFFSMCLPFASGITTIRSKFISKIIVHISKISYSMYLVHFSLVFRPFFSPSKETGFVNVILLYLLYLFIVFGLATLIYKFFESPVMKLRDRVGVKRRVQNIGGLGK